MVIGPWGDCVTGSGTSPSFLSNSLAHFTTNGFSVMGCGYYDTGNLIGATNWIQLLLDFTNACGLMYATWMSPPDFSMLTPFGDLMTSTIGLDENSNGIPDVWEVRYFGETNAVDGEASNDPDHDGMNNLKEYLSGTNPTNAASVFKIEESTTASPTGMVLRWSSVENKWYAIQTSTNLFAGFNEVTISNIPATPTMNTQTVIVDQVESRYYRVTVEP
jgi:hypothetical protein